MRQKAFPVRSRIRPGCSVLLLLFNILLAILCTLFWLLWHQLHLRSSGIRSWELGTPALGGVPSVVGGGLCRWCHRPGCWGLPCVEAASGSLVVPGPKEAGCRAPWDLELVLAHWWAWPGSRERQGCCPPTGGWSQVLGLVPDDWQAEPCPGVWL